ncbi:MAG: aldo/keto reductase, partial [Bacillota bacterium]
MLYTKLGQTGLKVSKLCLGTYNFDFTSDLEQSKNILDLAFELGINFIDTADIYGWHGKGVGSVESLIGDWLKNNSGKREKIILATKVYGEMGDGVNDKGLSKYHILNACEKSLARLKTDHIDVYFMHHSDPKTPLDEIWQAFEILIHQGKVLYIGTSNYAAWQVAKNDAAAKKRNLLGVVAEQPRYHLAARLIELELIPALRDLGIGLLPWSPLGGGLLAGRIVDRNDTGRRSREKKQKEFEEHKDQIEKYEKFCSELGEEPSSIALAWLLHNPVVTAPIIGPRTLHQLKSSMRSLEVKLGNVELEKLDEIWPGPEKEAPEA